ncbi:uncharacterized protein KY384_002649 [Bacidia gigantensis]|uniref:uncharacterized protein n=1 Tax=Bacidia gigantensis TaxID=2732470 RepID=UPI001D057696|nr:uncharacterized protein KY384_002649 [Bacidia gigantensis]KAG8532771.1 hypothetical protein KY384_002649 [Bacidia gigantensis]
MSSFPDFLNTSTEGPQPILFTGEMIFRGMFSDFAELSAFLDVANIIAAVNDWPDLYDEEQLAMNEVPVYSAIYVEDMYVDYDLARATATRIKNCKTFITNVLYHDALGNKTDELIRRLFDLRDDVLD